MRKTWKNTWKISDYRFHNGKLQYKVLKQDETKWHGPKIIYSLSAISDFWRKHAASNNRFVSKDGNTENSDIESNSEDISIIENFSSHEHEIAQNNSILDDYANYDLRESENDDENDDDKIEDDYQNEVDENIVKDENLYDSDSLIENEIDAGQNERPITILGIVKSYEGDDMKNPGIRIAVRFENRSEIHIVPSAVLRKLCPYQLSKFYEQCITFDEDEACTIHPIT